MIDSFLPLQFGNIRSSSVTFRQTARDSFLPLATLEFSHDTQS